MKFAHIGIGTVITFGKSDHNMSNNYFLATLLVASSGIIVFYVNISY